MGDRQLMKLLKTLSLLLCIWILIYLYFSYSVGCGACIGSSSPQTAMEGRIQSPGTLGTGQSESHRTLEGHAWARLSRSTVTCFDQAAQQPSNAYLSSAIPQEHPRLLAHSHWVGPVQPGMPILCLSHFFWLQNYWRFLTKPVLLGFSGVCALSTEGQIGELCVGPDCDVDWEEGTLWCLPSSADQMGMILKSSELLIVLVPHFQSQLQSYIAQYDEMKGRIWFAVVM